MAWFNSRLFYIQNLQFAHLEENHLRIDDGLILGDNENALCQYLMTTYADPVTRPEKRYNSAHKSTRCSVERSIGQLKRRFASLSRGLRLNPNKCCLVIVASVILHNIEKHLQEEDFEDEDENIYVLKWKRYLIFVVTKQVD